MWSARLGRMVTETGCPYRGWEPTESPAVKGDGSEFHIRYKRAFSLHHLLTCKAKPKLLGSLDDPRSNPQAVILATSPGTS